MAARGNGEAAGPAQEASSAQKHGRSQDLATIRPPCYLCLVLSGFARMSHQLATIKRVAVIGAGQMGAGIAQVAARAGLEVSLSDQVEAQAAQAVAKLEARLSRQEGDGKVPAGTTAGVVANIRTGGRLFGAAEADLVIEAAPEQLELKTE